MKECRGSIDSIETLGLLDGPGIRTVVFLNGCGLRCLYCHNPEMWKRKEYNITVNELVNKILKYKPYYQNNGGVTFSGGEPLLQSKFLIEVCKKLKQENINIALDTAGFSDDYKELLKYIDLVIFDIKALDDEDYYKLTKQSINKSLKFLDTCQNMNKKMRIRQVIVPGINDNPKKIMELKKFVDKLSNIEKIELLPYHSMAVDKYKKLGIDYPLKEIDDMDVEKCKGLENILKKM